MDTMTAPNRQPDGPPSPVATSEPTERLSFVRLGAALAVLALLVAGVWIGLRRVGDDPVTLDTSWSVPYVDVTLMPSYQFQNPSSNPARSTWLFPPPRLRTACTTRLTLRASRSARSAATSLSTPAGLIA